MKVTNEVGRKFQDQHFMMQRIMFLIGESFIDHNNYILRRNTII